MDKKTPNSISKATLKKLRGDTAEERALHRLHSVALVLAGVSAKDAAKFYGDSPRAVAYWVERFRAEGYNSLFEKDRSGRPSRLNDSQSKQLRAFVEAERANERHLNAVGLARYIKASFNVSITERQCWRILKAIV